MDRHKLIQWLTVYTCNHFGITRSSLLSNSRRLEYAIPRSIISNLLKEFSYLSYPAIANVLGKRDHTTIMHHIKQKENKKSFWHLTEVWGAYDKIKWEMLILFPDLRGNYTKEDRANVPIWVQQIHKRRNNVSKTNNNKRRKEVD